MCAQSLELRRCRQVRWRTEPRASTVINLNLCPMSVCPQKWSYTIISQTAVPQETSYPLIVKGCNFLPVPFCPKPAGLLYRIAANVHAQTHSSFFNPFHITCSISVQRYFKSNATILLICLLHTACTGAEAALVHASPLKTAAIQ